MKKQVMTVQEAAEAIASMKTPSVEKILRGKGYGYEADRIKDLVDAVEAAKPPLGGAQHGT